MNCCLPITTLRTEARQLHILYSNCALQFNNHVLLPFCEMCGAAGEVAEEKQSESSKTEEHAKENASALIKSSFCGHALSLASTIQYRGCKSPQLEDSRVTQLVSEMVISEAKESMTGTAQWKDGQSAVQIVAAILRDIFSSALNGRTHELGPPTLECNDGNGQTKSDAAFANSVSGPETSTSDPMSVFKNDLSSPFVHTPTATGQETEAAAADATTGFPTEANQDSCNTKSSSPSTISTDIHTQKNEVNQSAADIRTCIASCNANSKHTMNGDNSSTRNQTYPVTTVSNGTAPAPPSLSSAPLEAVVEANGHECCRCQHKKATRGLANSLLASTAAMMGPLQAVAADVAQLSSQLAVHSNAHQTRVETSSHSTVGPEHTTDVCNRLHSIVSMLHSTVIEMKGLSQNLSQSFSDINSVSNSTPCLFSPRGRKEARRRYLHVCLEAV